MKKLVCILLALMTLCACAEEPQNEVAREQRESSVSESENGENTFLYDQAITYLGTVDETEIYKKAVETGEMRLDIVYGKDGVLNSIVEVPATEFWIIDKEENLLIEHPFYDMSFWENEIRGCYKGDWYRYIFADGKFELDVVDKAGEFELSGYLYPEDYENYIPILYNYVDYLPNFGLADKDGNIIFEPIFAYVLSIPFEDRVIGVTNNQSRNDGSYMFTTLFDFDKNIICTYSDIFFYKFDDGSYIGLASYYGYGENWGHILKDENGNIIETGSRFIDKDGNVLSPCFDLFSIEEFSNYGTYKEIIENHLDETVYFTDKNGNESKITIRDYLVTE